MSDPYKKSPTAIRSEEQLAEIEFTSAFAEAVNNGQAIDWKYWARLAKWSASEAARLMCALDPDIFESLDAKPNNNDSTGPALKAKKIQRLAEREELSIATPQQWLDWADRHGLQIHDGLRIEVEAVADKEAGATQVGQVPVQRAVAQDIAILAEIKRQGYEPSALPKNTLGKAGIKSAVWKVLKSKAETFVSKKVFDTAWQRLRDGNELKDA